ENGHGIRTPLFQQAKHNNSLNSSKQNKENRKPDNYGGDKHQHQMQPQVYSYVIHMTSNTLHRYSTSKPT
ncbi:MAG: hypothetical protein IKC90_08195, partial [Akkermansia sp.]|nr:hypothetical protein [Akkermansia sp.]